MSFFAAGTAKEIEQETIELVGALGRPFFALGLIGIGTTHFAFGTFALGRAPAWPASWAGTTAFAWITGLVVIVAGLAVLIDKRAREAAIVAGAMVLVWALLRHVPVLFESRLLGGAWTSFGKAATFTGGLFAMAGGARGRIAARIALAVFLAISGIQHFMFTPFVVTLIPEWFPGDATLLAQAAGAALFAGGLGLLASPVSSRVASRAALGVGAMLYFWVWIVHLPRVFASVSDGIAIFEALAFSGLALFLAKSLTKTDAYPTHA